MKIKGADIIAFFQEWPPGTDVCYDSCTFTEGEVPEGSTVATLHLSDEYGSPGAIVDPTAKYDLEFGTLDWQGKGPVPAGFNSDFVAVVRKWLKARTVTSLSVTVPNEAVEAFKEYCASQKWKVSS